MPLFYEMIFTLKNAMKKTLVKFHACICAVIMHRICYLQRHQNSGQLMTAGYAQLPYTATQVLYHAGAPAKEKNGAWNPPLPYKERGSFL